MLLQAMVLIATMVVLAGVLFTSTLASAHAAFHEMILAKTQTATSDATARFATWAQDQVIRYGTEQSWPTTPQPTNSDRTVGVSTPVCDSTGAQGNAASTNCAMTATMRWKITGWSANPNAAQATAAGSSVATNLSTTLHEQRISAMITVELVNSTSHTIYATHSRRVTARVFDAYPYVAVTAMRDASSEDLTDVSLEGDTGGFKARNVGYIDIQPNRETPFKVAGTTINTTIDCTNAVVNDDQANPLADSNSGTYVRTRAVGNQAWVYEAPCNPTYVDQINRAGAPSDYRSSRGNLYANDTSVGSSLWTKSIKRSTFSH